MNTDSIKTWLKKNKSQRMAQKFLGACFSFFGGVIVLLFTFGLAYIVARIAMSGFFSVVELVSGAKWQLADGWFLLISGVFVVLLFVQYLRMDPWSWGRYASAETYTGTPMQRRFEETVKEVADALVPGSQAPSAREYLRQSGTAAKVIADVLVTGPRLFLGLFWRLKELSQINSIQVDQCAAALAFLYERPGSVSYEDFCRDGRGEQLKQLKNIDGVSFLKNGILLSDELRDELNSLK